MAATHRSLYDGRLELAPRCERQIDLENSARQDRVGQNMNNMGGVKITGSDRGSGKLYPHGRGPGQDATHSCHSWKKGRSGGPFAPEVEGVEHAFSCNADSRRTLTKESEFVVPHGHGSNN